MFLIGRSETHNSQPQNHDICWPLVKIAIEPGPHYMCSPPPGSAKKNSHTHSSSSTMIVRTLPAYILLKTVSTAKCATLKFKSRRCCLLRIDGFRNYTIYARKCLFYVIAGKRLYIYYIGRPCVYIRIEIIIVVNCINYSNAKWFIALISLPIQLILLK